MLNQVVRYEPVARVVAGVACARSLLEVGSGARGIARFLGPHWRITVTDVDFTDYGTRVPGVGAPRLVPGDVRALPFADRSFDVAVAVDLLEHVPPADREQALRELARVAARLVVVGCPCGRPALAADSRLADRYRSRGAAVPVWLAEHLSYGFPDEMEISATLGTRGRLEIVANEWLPSHEVIGLLEARPALGRMSELAGGVLSRGIRRGGRVGQVTRTTVRALRGGDRAPAYRSLFILHL